MLTVNRQNTKTGGLTDEARNQKNAYPERPVSYLCVWL